MFNPIAIEGGSPVDTPIASGFKELSLSDTLVNPPPETSGFSELPIEEIKPVKEPVIEDVQEEEKNVLLEGGKTATKFVGKQLLGAAELAMSTASGALLWPFSKAWGVLNLPFGADAAKKAEESIQALGYSPYTEEGQKAAELVGEAFEIALMPAKMAQEATKNLEINITSGKYGTDDYKKKNISEEIAYLVGLGSELAEFSIAGGAYKGVKKALTPKNKWDAKPKEFPEMDSEFAEGQVKEKANEINIRRAKQKAQGKPLTKLKREEDILKMERDGIDDTGAPIARKTAEFEETFKPISIEESIHNQTLDVMQSEVNNSRTRGVTQEKVGIEGETVAFSADSPQWMRDLPKDDGKVYTRKQINAVIDNVRNGKKLTPKQEKLHDHLMDAANKESVQNPEMQGSFEPAELKSKGFEVVGQEKFPVAELNKGDKIIGTIDGVKDEYVVKGVDKNGDVAFKDGVTKKAHLFDDISVDGLKKAEQSRTIKDTLEDVNTLIGKRGELGDASMTPEQTAAYKRLSGDMKVYARNAKRVGKTVEDYLSDLGVDPKIAALLGKKSKELEKYAGSINLERQDIPKEFKQFETEIQNPKRVQTWDETGALSKDIQQDYKKASKMLDKGKKGEAFTAAEYDATRQINVNAISSLKDTLKSNPEKFEAQYQKYKADVFNVLSDASSEAGRALNIHKRIVSVDRMGKAFAKLERSLNSRELKELKELDLENPLEIKRFVSRLGDPKISDYFLEFWYNSILSGPPTHLVNAVGNTMWMAYQVPHRVASALVDIPYSKLTGKQRTRYLNEVVPMLMGLKSGFKRGKKMAWQVLKDGKIQDFESKWAQEMSSSIGAFERSPNKVLRELAPFITPPTKALRAMDAWANAMGYDATVNSMARRSSNKLGLKGKEKFQHEKDFAENLTVDQHAESMREAKHFTFMDDPDPVTALIIKARNTPVVGPILKLSVLPFVNTISNLMKRGTELTPGIGLVKEGISRGMGRGRSTPEVIAKQVEGAIIAAYVWDKITKGEITGEMPTKKTEREAWYRKGRMPWAIKMGDTWVSYRRMEPYNTVIAAAHVAYNKALNADDQDTADEIFFEIAKGMKNNLIDGSYFQGLQAVMNRHQKSKGALARFGASWVPYSSFFRSMSRAYEVLTEGSAKARGGNEYQKSFSTVLPWLIDKPPAKLDVWGEEAVIPGGILRQWLPFKWVEEKEDPVEKEFEKLGYYPAIPRQTVKIDGENVKLDDDIYRTYVQDFGYKAKAKMLKIISNPNYQRVSKEGKRDKRHEKRLKSAIIKIKNASRKRAIREQQEKN